MNNIEKELLKAISRQVTDNVPKLYIQNVVSGRVFEYGKNCHDKLLISEDGRCLTYYNLQDGDGSCVGDYRFYYEKLEDKTDFDADEWARTVEHQSIKELLAEEQKKVVQELKSWCDKNFNWVGDGTGYDGQEYNEMIGSNNTINKLREILDQIERGE